MKRRFSKILGVGLTLALLTSLVLTAAPVSAISVPTVSLDDDEISADAVYTITFTITEPLHSATGDKIVVTFDTGIDISAITDTVDGDVTIGCSSGIGVVASTAQDAGSTTDGQELTIDVPAMDGTDIGAGATVQLVIGAVNPIVNPDDVGDYTLDVSTLETDDTVIEAAVTSAAFTMIVPTIEVLPGIVQQYNATDILMDQKTGGDAITDMVASAGADYTIVVGPGEYALEAADTITITQAGLTLKSSAGAEDTTIDASLVTGGAPDNGAGIFVNAADVTVDGFTVVDAGACGIYVNGADAIIQNNVVANTSFGTGIDVATGATGVTVSDNVLNEYAAIILHGSNCTVSGNIFGHIMNFWALGTLEDVTITDNNFVANANANFGILLRGNAGSELVDDTLIEGNTINGRDNGGILLGFDAGLTVTDLVITGNDIINNGDATGEAGIWIDDLADWSTGNVIKFNTITGNEDYGIRNDTDDNVDATFNWWGTDGASVSDTSTGVTTTAPVLTDTADAVLSASDAVANATSLNASTTVGVAVSGATDATAISVFKYLANPQEAIAGAIAFYDVYVVTATAVDVTIKFYAGDANSKVYLWSADTEAWVEVTPVAFSTYGGYVYVDVDKDMLDGTPFAVVAGAAAALEAPEIISPDIGEKAVDLRPAFAWTAIAGVLGYEFELADNPNFVAPLMKLSGELGRLIVPYYQYMPQLDYSKAYYWRVRSVDATAESGWVGGVFITVAEVIPEPEEPEWMCSEGLTFDSRAALEAHLATAEAHKPVEPPEIIVEPDVEVIVPAETPITPAWIYVIIGVGAVLVIALIILIVRTRRVA